MNNNQIPIERMKVFVEVISRLDNESRIPDISKEEYARRAHAITYILRGIEKIWGKREMLDVIMKTKEKIGHTPGPLDYTIVKDFIDLGYKVTNIRKVMTYS